MSVAHPSFAGHRAPSLDAVVLRFRDAPLERQYHRSRLPHRFAATRLSALFGALTWQYFTLLDRFTIRDPAATLVYVRQAGFLFLIGIFLSTYVIKPGRWIEAAGVAGLAVNTVILTLYLFLMSHTSLNYTPPAAMFTMVAVTCFSLCAVTFLEGTALALLTLAAYFLTVTVRWPAPPDVIVYQSSWMFAVVVFAALGLYLLDRTQRIAWLQRLELAGAREEISSLLHNVLPPSIADRKLKGEAPIADDYNEASLLFADVVDFTLLSDRLTSTQVVCVLGELFGRYDKIAARYGLEKIKTIGDCYMLAGGIPLPDSSHLQNLAHAALEMLAATREVVTPDGSAVTVRIGMHTGPVTAGVIGASKFIFDVWGDTVNTASRMESHGTAGRIHVTEPVCAGLAQTHVFEGPMVIDVKGKGLVPVWQLVAARSDDARRSATRP